MKVSHEELTLDAMDAKLAQIETNTANINVNVDTLEVNTDGIEGLITTGNNTLSSVDNKVILPTALENGRLKCLLDANLGDTNSKIDAMRGSNSITDLATKLNGGLPSALDSDRLKVRLDADLGDTNNKIDALRAQLPSTLGNKSDANSLSICRSTEQGAFDMSARETIADASTTKNLQCSSTGKLLVKISNESDTHNVKLEDLTSNLNAHNSNSGGSSGRSLCVSLKGRTDITSHATGDAKFLLCNSAGKLQVDSETRVSGEMFASASLGANSFSAFFDLSDYKQVHIFGQNTDLSNATALQIYGSLTNGGTPYWLGSLNGTLAIQNITEDATLKNYYDLVIDNPPPFIQIRNNTGSSTTFELDFVGTKV